MQETRQYELVYVMNPSAGEEAVNGLHAQVEEIITTRGGQIDKTDNWGRRRLAYEIDRHKEGTYVLELFSGTGEIVGELDRRLKVADNILRYLIVRVDEDLRKAERARSRRQARRQRRREARGLTAEPAPPATPAAATPAAASAAPAATPAAAPEAPAATPAPAPAAAGAEPRPRRPRPRLNGRPRRHPGPARPGRDPGASPGCIGDPGGGEGMKDERGGRRPSGGGPRRGGFRRRRVCRFCVDKIDYIDYKDVRLLMMALADRGKIQPRRTSGTCAKCQRKLTTAIKRARQLALIPYVTD